MTDQEKWQYWIETIQTEGKYLSKWEKDFVESISDQLQTKGRLFERQVEILERIYSEKTV
jgi:hypothetical protein